MYSGEVERPEYPDWCSPKFRLDKALALSNIPNIYLEANISNYKVDNDNGKVYEAVKPIVDNIVEEVDKGLNIFIFNRNPGTGKTFTSCTILNQFIYKTCLTNKFDFEHPLGYFQVYPDLMDDLRYRRDYESTQQRMKVLREVPLLLLDDIGAGTMTEFTREQTYLLLNSRINNGLSTILTSNFDIKDLRQSDALGSRVVSRILSKCLGINMAGRDRRMDSVRGSIK